jgi:alkanesulfonate monooxygenase SsuD/methylene tetrahydromethanopterin reductase-like flavin-dependent oxidoreductase (luciferase family)
MPRPKVILNLYPVFPADGFADRVARRPLGADRGIYQRVVHEWTEIIQAAERMGVWGCSAIEHHFHSEGYEVAPSPSLLNAYWAAQTSRIHIGALGYVIGTWDPIRLAEETAILDHLLKGRYWVGLSRGYQARWANVLGQHSGAVATVSDKSDADRKNREIFEERVDMLLRCWTEESVVLDSPSYQAPFPRTGVEGYPAWRTAQAAGAIGETDGNGRISRICVVPKPYQKPHPPVMVPTTKSIESIEFCARRGFIPVHFTPLPGVVEATRVYVELAARHGVTLPFGARQNLCRFPHVAPSRADFERRLREYDVDIYSNIYGPFFPQMPQGDADTIVEGMKASGLFVGGSLTEAKDEWRRIYAAAPCEYVTVIWHWAQVPKEVLLEELDLFMREIVPELEAAA